MSAAIFRESGIEYGFAACVEPEGKHFRMTEAQEGSVLLVWNSF